MSSVAWGGYLPAAFLISVTPGANQLLGFRNACRFGWAVAMSAVIGRLLALVVLTTVVALGLGELLARSATLFDVVRWVGVAYLAYLGIGVWWRSLRDAPDPDADVAERAPAAPETSRLFRQEFTVACTNPKALPLFAALLPASVHGGSPTLGLVLAGLGFVAVEVVTASGYTVAGARLRSAGVLTGREVVLQRITGTCLLAFAVLLALISRHAG